MNETTLSDVKRKKRICIGLDDTVDLVCKSLTNDKGLIDTLVKATVAALHGNSPRFILEAMVVFSFITTDCRVVCKYASSPALLLVTV